MLQLVHHHVSSLDQLVNKVYEALKPPESPAVQGKENEQAAAGKPKAPKHPLSKQLTRCWLLEVRTMKHCGTTFYYYHHGTVLRATRAGRQPQALGCIVRAGCQARLAAGHTCRVCAQEQNPCNARYLPGQAPEKGTSHCAGTSSPWRLHSRGGYLRVV